MRRYLQMLLVGALGLFGSAIAFNAAIDPYAVVGTPRIAGINADKPLLGRQSRLHTAADTVRKPIDALVVGASTAEGIPDQHAFWGDARVYVLAVGGANAYETFRYLQHVTANHKLRRVVIALDFFAFNGYRTPTVDFREDVLDVTVAGLPNPAAARERLRWLLSIDSLADSASTLLVQRRGGSGGDSGQRTKLREMFRQIDQAFIERTYLTPPAYRYAFDESPHGKAPMAVLADALALCRERGIAVDMFITPSHARALAVIQAIGLWPTFEAWKRSLADLGAHSPGVRAWDFSGFGPETTEALPPAAEPFARMVNYRDQIHFNPVLGTRILERFAGTPSDFGVELEPARIDAHLAAIRTGFRAWVGTAPDDVAEIAGLARAAGFPAFALAD